MKKNLILAVALFCTCSIQAQKKNSMYHEGWIDFNKNGKMDVYEDPSQPIEKRVENLLSMMTLEEKSCQVTTLYGAGRVLRDSLPTPNWKNEVWKDGIANIDEMLNGVEGAQKFVSLSYPMSVHVNALHQVQKFFVEDTRLGIPVEFTTEGIHGLNHTMATPLPAPIALGSTWNRNLIHQAGTIAGIEAKLVGYHSVYAPILDMARDQRWGRTLECYSEDPYLISELGIQMVNGIQEQGIASCLKHYAAYSVPKGGRDGNARTDPHITPRELHEIFLYPFKKVIQASHPWEVMSSYNDWNGLPVSGSHWFLTELLRDTYGFKGYVVSDSEAVEYLHSKHKVSSSYEQSATMALSAGLNVRTNFSPPTTFTTAVRNAVKQGMLSMDVLDQRVREVLNVKFQLGLFDNPYTGDAQLADKEAGAEFQQSFIDEIGTQAMVLLKNENNLLPLDKTKTNKVLVTGPLAVETNFMISRYGPNGLTPVSMLEGLQNYLGKEKVVFEKGCEIVDKNWPTSEIIPEPLTAKEEIDIKSAVNAAKNVDIIICCLGEGDKQTGEGRSRSSLDLPGRQRDLLMALYKTGKPIVLVLVNGQPLTINWENKYIPAILETWFPSYKGGDLVAKMLFGETSPSGKLPITFPKSIGQIEWNFPFKRGSHAGPAWHNTSATRVLGSLYPFGYGLTYTSFAYNNLSISHSGSIEGDVNVSVDITNTGQREGEEVVQLYVSDLITSVAYYESVLRGFERVSLKPGETKTVKFTLHPEDLQIYGINEEWVVEPGEFEIRIGASSEDIKVKQTIELN